MQHQHLTAERLLHLLEQGTDQEVNRLLLHQLALCPACYEVGGYILDLYSAGAIDLSFCSVDLELARSRAEAPTLRQKLEGFSFDQQRGLISDLPRFKSWGLAELLCQESQEDAVTDAAAAIQRASLAVAVAEVLDDWQPAERSWLLELRAVAWAHLGNARRVAGDLRAAEEAFGEALRLWEEGASDVGDVLGYEAKLLALLASLRRAQRRLPEALALLERATLLEPTAKLRAIILLNKAKLLEETGEVEAALVLLEDPATEAIVAGEPTLTLHLRHNLLDALTKAGRFTEAARLLPEVEELGGRLGGALDRVRLRWTMARITAGLGDREGAIVLFEAVRQDFASQEIGFDMALVSLELTTLHAELGHTEAVRAIAAEVLPIFESQEVHREAIGALVVFEQAVQAERLTVELSRRIRDYLLRSRYNLTLQFREDDELLC
jgi:tetratricopeptide (TPR) repeat protein